ncbi:MAG: DUF3592 domain-containing protein [Erythrobacter sp.]
MPKAKLLIGGIFTPMGLLFSSIGGAFYLSDSTLDAKGGRATGTVVALNAKREDQNRTMYTPEVEFTDPNGQTHRLISNISSSTPDYRRGERVEVIYDPAAPKDAVIDSFMQRHFFPMIFGSIGSLFAVLGGWFLWSHWQRRQTIAHLQKRGLPIQAKFTHSYIDRSTEINGRSPYVVVAQATHPATGKLASFESEHISIELTPTLDGKTVPVFIDMNDPDEHYIDLSQWVGKGERA